MAAAGAAAAPPAGAAAPPPPPAPAAAAAAAALAAAAAAAASRPAWTRLSARLALATVLFVLGCAAAALAFFAMSLPPADSRIVGSCAPTDAEAADLRAGSEKLLLAASAQVLGATVALLVPVRAYAVSSCFLGWFTAYRVMDVLGMLVACHGDVHGALAAHYWVFFVLLLMVLVVGIVVSMAPDR